MDGLSRFQQGSIEVKLASEENNTIDTLADRLANIERELLLKRKADEAFVYGQEVEGNDEVDLDDVEPKEGE